MIWETVPDLRTKIRESTIKYTKSEIKTQLILIGKTYYFLAKFPYHLNVLLYKLTN